MITRTYRASSQAKAAAKMAADGAPPGYVLGGQSWASGGRTCAASAFVIVGVLLLVVGLAFPPLWALAIVALVIGLVSGKGDGELTVTWVPSQQPTAVESNASPQPAQNHAATLSQLKAMLDQGLITPDEYESKKAELLSRM